MTHLECLCLRLSNEKVRLESAKNEKERSFRKVLVAQIEKEIAGEIDFLDKNDDIPEMSDDELLSQLGV